MSPHVFPPAFPFDVILFDVGGVLLTNGWDTRERALAIERFHLDAADLEARHHANYPAWERGAISVNAYLDATVFTEPRSFSHDEFFAFMLAQSKILPDSGLGTLKEVAASNKCMVGALNNEARETNKYRFETFGLFQYFKAAFSSCYLGLRKPDAAIYQAVLDILGRPAQKILFIDDRIENVTGAINAGMKAIQFVGEKKLQSDLASLGVL
jgi:putative hydrolase of the HAD superfamily